MSEREVYDMLRMHYEVCYDGCKCGRCSEVHEAIAESKKCPDVVAVARVCREYEPGLATTRGSKLYNEGWRDAVNAVADNLERKYGFRLTDGGWEWTE